MREIQLRGVKATLSSVVDDAARGRPEAVVIGFEDWQRLTNVPSFGRLLMLAPLGPDDLPERDRTPAREVEL